MKNAILISWVFSLMFVGTVSATIIDVPGDYSTIQAGIDASSNGDTVLVQPDTYIENINFNGHNIVLGSLFLTTGDTNFISTTIIDGGASGSVVTFENGEDNTVIITGFTIQNGNTSFAGGGISCDYSYPTISYNTISGNSANYHGGGISCRYNSSPTINYNTVSGNSVNTNGGGIFCCDNSNPTISNNTISGNSAYRGGGISCYDSSPPITNTIFWGDSAPNEPEIYLDGSSPVITYCDVQGGWAGEGNINCGPMFCDPDNGNFYLHAISCCVGAGEGGVDIGAFGVGCYPYMINIPADYETIQEGIDASSHGDTVRVASGTYVENIDFSGKNIVLGSWFLDDGDPSFILSTIIDGNESASVVSFLNGEDNTAVITGFTIQNGNAQNGGGIYCDYSSPTINYNNITGNTANYDGGGIFCYNNSNSTISNNTITANSATGGGGICCYTYSNPMISYNTITGNTASSHGGGIYCYYNSNPTISNNTISGNLSNYGGGIRCYDSSPIITNTIFWADSAPTGQEIHLGGTSSPVITYCDIQGGWSGEGNIDCDPMFCDPESGNFYLDAASCCVGAGEGGVDIGAFGVGCVSGSITGIVADVFSRNPVWDATVNAWQEGSIVATDVTETDGAYLLEGLDVGLYDVEFIADGYFDDTVTGVEVLAGQVTTVDMLLHKPGYYSGVVSDYYGTELEGVSVEAAVQVVMMSIEENTFADDAPMTLDVTPVLSDVTDEFGQYTLILEPGTYDITYSMTGWDTQVVTDVVINLDDVVTNADVTLRSPNTLTGLVSDVFSRNLLQDVHVTVDDGVFFGEDWTDVDGSYSIGGIYDGDYTITFDTAGYFPEEYLLYHINDGPALAPPLNVVLHKPGYYGGVVSDFYGTELEGVSVEAAVQVVMMSIEENTFADDAPMTLDVTPVLSDVTDEFGQYTLILEPGTYDITYSMTGWDTQVVTDVVINLDDVVTNADVTLRRVGTLGGTVTEAEAEPPGTIEDVHVTVDDGVFFGDDFTDENGYYLITSIYDGDFTITYSHEDYDTLIIVDRHINDGQHLVIDTALVFSGYEYLPGDVNMALGIWPPTVIGGDVTYLVGYFIGGGQESCLLDGFWCSADINGDCLIIGGDVTALVGYFVAGGSLVPCPDYQSVWPPLPEEAPAGWPNCDTPVINSRVIPTGSVK